MFIIFLKFSENKSQAPEFMQEHNSWLKQGFDDGIFVLAGSLQPKLGGCILAHNTTSDELMTRVNNDPFVVKNIVSTEILEVDPAKAVDQMQFLMN